MFTTPENILKTTGKEVTAEDVYRAQVVIEIYVGRGEAAVKNGRDRAMLERAVIMQTIYQLENYDMVYEQVAAAAISNNGSLITYQAGDKASPHIAPLAVMACRHLSWLKSKSVRTGKTLQRRGSHPFLESWLYD